MWQKTFWKYRIYAFLFLLLIIVGAFIFVNRSSTRQSAGSSFAADALSPWQKLTTRAGRTANHAWQNVIFFFSLKADNVKLNNELALLKQQNNELTEAVKENERLRSALNFKKKTPYRVKGSLVIGYDPNNYFGVITIDLGSKDGIEKDLPVISPDGLVGKIMSVTEDTSGVLLISDLRSSISCLVQRSRGVGSVRGKGQDLCEMKYLSINDDVKAGDKIITSGDGKIFPKGILVGEVTAVSPTSDGMSYDVSVKPSVNVLRLEEVFVVGKY
ncbi:MAG: rod shape-determining protein MreC [Candidatus Firestonebacteria bacterium]